MREAEKIGSATLALFDAIMHAKPHPERGFRSCLAILRLCKEYGADRLEAACRRGNDIIRALEGPELAIVAIRGVGSLWRFAKYARDNRH